MQWFVDWWQGLDALSQAFACAALPATVIMLLQTILLLFGAGFGHDADDGGGDGFDHDHGLDCDHDHDFDGDHDFDHDHSFDSDHDASQHDGGLRIFTVRGLIAFFAIGGWVGIVAIDSGLAPAPSVILAVIAGTAALLFAAYVIKWALKMQDSGNIRLNNAIAHMGTVYIPIPPRRSGTGRITLLLQDRLTELDAMTDSGETLKTGTPVQVTGVSGGTCLIVRPMILQEKE